MTAHNKQIGGTHYSKLAIQPMEYALKNGLNFAQGNVVKYVTRYKSKGGIEDLRKAAHYIEVLIQHEIEQRQIADGWTPEAIDAAAFPASYNESRIDVIGQNGNDGAAYEQRELLALPEDAAVPVSVDWIGVDADGETRGYEGDAPSKVANKHYMRAVGSAKSVSLFWQGESDGTPKLYKRTPNGFERVLD